MSPRITGGHWAGLLLAGPPRTRDRRGNPVSAVGVRPTAARLRKSLFAILADELPGVRVLDVCAGAGTLGFEALSRGARECVFVERSRRMAGLIRRNAARLGAPSCRVLVGDGESELRRLAAAGERFGLVLLDPPWEEWESGGGGRLLAAAAALAPLLAAEHRSSWTPPDGVGGKPGVPGEAAALVRTRTTTAGDGAFSLYRRETDGETC